MSISSVSPLPVDHGPAVPWFRQAALRASRLRALKTFGTMGFMLLFFAGYFGVMRHPLAPPTVMPLTIIDEWIPFTPAAFGAYVSLWVYVSLAPAFLPDRRQLLGYGLWIGALCLFCLVVFWLWPTTIPQDSVDWAAHPGLAMIKGIDLSGNACPSLHVATAVFSAVWLQHILNSINAPRWLAVANWLHCAAIVWSTMAIRQHVAVDVLAGIAVGLAFAALSLRHLAHR